MRTDSRNVTHSQTYNLMVSVESGGTTGKGGRRNRGAGGGALVERLIWLSNVLVLPHIRHQNGGLSGHHGEVVKW